MRRIQNHNGQRFFWGNCWRNRLLSRFRKRLLWNRSRRLRRRLARRCGGLCRLRPRRKCLGGRDHQREKKANRLAGHAPEDTRIVSIVREGSRSISLVRQTRKQLTNRHCVLRLPLRRPISEWQISGTVASYFFFLTTYLWTVLHIVRTPRHRTDSRQAGAWTQSWKSGLGITSNRGERLNQCQIIFCVGSAMAWRSWR